ncbi:hypothetical protein LTR28_003338 [Elasticomyces elasticus]|nr:hypothetical protein LTR28_003338 [Elasticomyces elasticus]
MALSNGAESLLSPPRDEEHPILDRTPSSYNPLLTFNLAKGEKKHYQQQYADMYFARLAQLKPAVEQIAGDAWEDFEVLPASIELTYTRLMQTDMGHTR